MPQPFTTAPPGGLVPAEPYTLHIPEQDIDEFKVLLKASKIGPDTYENQDPGRALGISKQWLIDAKDTWLNHYDWRRQEERINSFPNFKMPVHDPQSGDFSIHFIALFSTRSDAVPVIFMHGWPGSFMEFLPIFEILSNKYTPETLPYHVIVPSLPGFAMSSGPPLDRDFTLLDATRVLNQLMINLGFGSGYIAQGGDIGSMLSRIMSSQHDECKAFHTNVFVLVENEMKDPKTLSDKETKKLKRAQAFRATGYGYALEHGTRPATIGLTLSSSPLALLAWIGEKFQEWADEPLPLETVLNHVALYWFTSTFPRSIYSYRFVLGRAGKPMPTSKEKPFGVSDFPAEIAVTPRSWLEAEYPNLIFYNEHDKGGHFAALEQPEALLVDVEAFIQQVRKLITL